MEGASSMKKNIIRSVLSINGLIFIFASVHSKRWQNPPVYIKITGNNLSLFF
jgi:hypothetical protein